MEADIKVRVAWIDIAKATTILLVIIGHSVSEILCGVINWVCIDIHRVTTTAVGSFVLRCSNGDKDR